MSKGGIILAASSWKEINIGTKVKVKIPPQEK